MFGESLRKARKDSDLSLDALAQILAEELGEKLSREAVRKWEKGESSPEKEKWSAIEKVLSLPEGWVFALISAEMKAKDISVDAHGSTRSPSAAISANHVGRVHVSADNMLVSGHGEYHVTMSKKEYEVWEAYCAMKRPEVMLDACLDRLKKFSDIMRPV